jgi:hypothetical protein
MTRGMEERTSSSLSTRDEWDAVPWLSNAMGTGETKDSHMAELRRRPGSRSKRMDCTTRPRAIHVCHDTLCLEPMPWFIPIHEAIIVRQRSFQKSNPSAIVEPFFAHKWRRLTDSLSSVKSMPPMSSSQHTTARAETFTGDRPGCKQYCRTINRARTGSGTAWSQ